jgi:hypothetical protein
VSLSLSSLVDSAERRRKSLGDEDADALLQTLIGFLVQFLSNGERALVVRKLCSTLVAYFLQFSIKWTRCIKHLMYCLYTNHAVPYQGLDDDLETATMVQNISNEKAVAILWFAAALVEEVGKTDSNSMKQLSLYQAIWIGLRNADTQVDISFING